MPESTQPRRLHSTRPKDFLSSTLPARLTSLPLAAAPPRRSHSPPHAKPHYNTTSRIGTSSGPARIRSKTPHGASTRKPDTENKQSKSSKMKKASSAAALGGQAGAAAIRSGDDEESEASLEWSTNEFGEGVARRKVKSSPQAAVQKSPTAPIATAPAAAVADDDDIEWITNENGEGIAVPRRATSPLEERLAFTPLHPVAKSPQQQREVSTSLNSPTTAMLATLTSPMFLPSKQLGKQQQQREESYSSSRPNHRPTSLDKHVPAVQPQRTPSPSPAKLAAKSPTQPDRTPSPAPAAARRQPAKATATSSSPTAAPANPSALSTLATLAASPVAFSAASATSSPPPRVPSPSPDRNLSTLATLAKSSIFLAPAPTEQVPEEVDGDDTESEPLQRVPAFTHNKGVAMPFSQFASSPATVSQPQQPSTLRLLAKSSILRLADGEQLRQTTVTRSLPVGDEPSPRDELVQG